MAGNISRTIWMAAGPTSTTKNAGKMKITSGKMSFTAVLAAFSSAICCRRTRIESLWTRRAWATLDPNLSAWIKSDARNANRRQPVLLPQLLENLVLRATHLHMQVAQSNFVGKNSVALFHFFGNFFEVPGRVPSRLPRRRRASTKRPHTLKIDFLRRWPRKLRASSGI